MCNEWCWKFPCSNNKHEHKKSPRLSTLESNLDFLVYRGRRIVSATPTILWKERTINHILRAFLTFRNHANTLYRTDCLNGKSTSSDFNMIQPGFRGTECSKTAFYRRFYQFLNSTKCQKKKKKKNQHSGFRKRAKNWAVFEGGGQGGTLCSLPLWVDSFHLTEVKTQHFSQSLS